jgi:PAS domain S-box-containing protein
MHKGGASRDTILAAWPGYSAGLHPSAQRWERSAPFEKAISLGNGKEMDNPQKSTILVVDDEQPILEALRELLAMQGYNLAFASDGFEALEAAAKLLPDLILLDVMMPDLDGFEVCRRLRADPRLAQVPVVMLTALNDGDSRLRGIEAGADEFLSKPFDPAELLARVRTITRLNRYRRLLEERAKFEQVIRFSPNGILIVDEKGIIRLASPAAQRMLDLEKTSLLKKSVRGFVAPGHLESFEAFLEKIMTGRHQTEQIETRLVRADGRQIPVEADGAFFSWEDEMGAQIVLRDISERKEAEERIERQLQRLITLHNIDLAITDSLDLDRTLGAFLEQITEQLHLDAASILLFDSNTQRLEYSAGRGFSHGVVPASRLPLEKERMVKLALDQWVFSVPDLLKNGSGQEFLRARGLESEGFVSYFAAPLSSKGQVKGLLEIFNRTHLHPDLEWLSFLQTLTTQAVIAIENAELYHSLQKTHQELTQAYDATLEGWSRALELRDKETEHHTQRVTEMTVRLARAMGLEGPALMHIRRGALLHDIGKMGIPDGILLKPGSLTDAEEEIMQRHPTYAYEMLSPIPYLRPALDIPYCHHERWDGAGYPRGLKGEEIPLAARIFAVVDVWDALRSDRPYRSAWPEEEVRTYIRQQAGKQFDPQVVEVFLSMDWTSEPGLS